MNIHYERYSDMPSPEYHSKNARELEEDIQYAGQSLERELRRRGLEYPKTMPTFEHYCTMLITSGRNQGKSPMEIAAQVLEKIGKESGRTKA